MQRSEGRVSESFGGVESRQSGLRVLQSKGAVTHVEESRVRPIFCRDLDFVLSREGFWRLRLQGERKSAALRQFVLIHQLDIRGRSRRIGIDALANKTRCGPRGVYGRRKVNRASIA